MSDINSKKNIKQKNANTKRKIAQSSSKKTTKPKTYTKVITKAKNNKLNKINRMCTLALIASVSIVFLFLLSNRTFFRGEYKVKNVTIDIPHFMFFSSDKDGFLTLKTWRNYNDVKAYFDEYLANLDRFDFYGCSDGSTLYYNEDKKLAVYDIDIKRSFFIKTITINYKIVELDKVCD